MRILFWLTLGSMLAGLLFRIPFGGGGILLADLLLPMYAVCYLFKKIVLERSVPVFYIWGASLTFLVIALVSWILGAWELDMTAKILSFAYIIRFISIIILASSVRDVLEINKSEDNSETKSDIINNFFKKLFNIVFLIIFIGFVQFYFIPDISSFSTTGGFDPHMGRLLGTWMDPNFVAGLLAFFIPLMVGKFYQDFKNQVKTKNNKNLYYLAFLILFCLYAGFLTFSRSGYLSIAFGLFFFFLFRDPKIILIGVVVATLGVFSNERALKRVTDLTGTFQAVLFRDTDEVDVTAKLRVQSWQKTLSLWEKYPYLGVGYNTYRYRGAEEGVVDESYFSSGGSDSTLLTVLVTTGVTGFLAFLYFYARILFRNWLAFRRTKNPIFLGFVSGWLAIVVHSVFVNSFLFPLIFMPMMVVVGVLALIEEE